MWPFRRGSVAAPLSVEAGLSEYFDLKDEWLRSACRDALLGLLQQYKPPGGWPITQAIVTGLGATLAEMETRWRERHFLQLIVFLDIVDNLQDEGGPKIELYAQELDTTAAEMELLGFLGIQTIVDPEAQDMSRPGVFVFAPGCPIDVEMVGQCKHRHPSLFLGVPIVAMLGREQDIYINNARNLAEDSTVPVQQREKWAKRVVNHIQRVELLQAYQEVHAAVKFPRHEVRKRDEVLKRTEFQFGLLSASDCNGSCEHCVGGGRFAYRDCIGDGSGNRKSSCYIDWRS